MGQGETRRGGRVSPRASRQPRRRVSSRPMAVQLRENHMRASTNFAFTNETQKRSRAPRAPTPAAVAEPGSGPYDDMPMIVRCDVEGCDFRFEGPSSRARAEAAAHRDKTHPFLEQEAAARRAARQSSRGFGRVQARGRRWTEEAALVVCREFAERTGFAPSRRDFEAEDALPSAPTIAKLFGGNKKLAILLGYPSRSTLHRGTAPAGPGEAGPAPAAPVPGEAAVARLNGHQESGPAVDGAESTATRPTDARAAGLQVIAGLQSLVDALFPE